MKKILNILALLLVSLTTYAQNNLFPVYITDDLSIHFRSPEPIQYVDISSNQVIGDLPVENILRIKFFPQDEEQQRYESLPDSLKVSVPKPQSTFPQGDIPNIAVVTIVGQSYMAQYKIHYVQDKFYAGLQSEFEIEPYLMKPLEFPNVTMTRNEMKKLSVDFLKKKPTFNNVHSKGLGLSARLNNIFSVGDYIFVDVTFNNKTNIKYDIDEIRFKIEDKKIVKATNVQEVEVRPEFSLYNNKSFRKNFRNIYVFKKFTFPNSKVLNIQITEEQISGRMLELKIDYRDMLNADTL